MDTENDSRSSLSISGSYDPKLPVVTQEALDYWAEKMKSRDPVYLEAKELCKKLKNFVAKIKRHYPDGNKSSRLLETCIGIQHHIRNKGKKDSIFFGDEYEDFIKAITSYLEEDIHGTEKVDEAHFWETGQLGVATMDTLLFTLIYYNLKYFQLLSCADHASLSFNDYSVTIQRKGETTFRQLCYKGRAALDLDESEPSVRYFAWLFQYYKDKCENGSDIFYKSRIPFSSEDDGKWYGCDPLPPEKIQRMLVRAKMISRISQATTVDINHDGAIYQVVEDLNNYKMDHPQRGRAIIFNHEIYLKGRLKQRHGSKKDCARLLKTLQYLNFSVEVLNNLRVSEIKQQLKQLAQEDHSNRDCVLVAVFTHGDNGIIAAYDKVYSVSDLWKPFTPNNAPSLYDKPKIFLIQACQGGKLDHGAKNVLEERNINIDTETNRGGLIPTYADFLIAYGSFPGYVSFRKCSVGSWFIQKSCAVLEKYADKEDLLSMMTRVCGQVSILETNEPGEQEIHQKKQVPYLQHTLRRKIYLRYQN